jgi:hypothetical protein
MDITHQAPAEAQALAVLESGDPDKIIQRATRAAELVAQVIEHRKLYTMIPTKKGPTKHVNVEGWQAAAILMGFVPSEVSAKSLGDGTWEATVELLHARTGRSLAKASSMCGGPMDKDWANSAPINVRSMAVTRATGKVCRLAFAWVVALAGFETTPAEEMAVLVVAPRNAAQPDGNGAAPDVALVLKAIENAANVDALTLIREEQLPRLKGKDNVNAGAAWRARLKELGG